MNYRPFLPCVPGFAVSHHLRTIIFLVTYRLMHDIEGSNMSIDFASEIRSFYKKNSDIHF